MDLAELYYNLASQSREYREKVQEINRFTRVDIPTDMIQRGQFYDLDNKVSALNTKIVDLTFDLLKLSFIELSNKVEFNKKYSLEKFFNLTGIMIDISYIKNSYPFLVRIPTYKSYITIYSRFSVELEFVDVDLCDKYHVSVNRLCVGYEKTKTISMSTDVDGLKNHVLYIDGTYQYITPSYSNGRYYINASAVNGMVEHLTFKDVLVNKLIDALPVNNVPCITINDPSASALSSNLLFYYCTSGSNSSDLYNGPPVRMTNKSFKVPLAATYWVLAFHNSSLASAPNDFIAKFDNTIGISETNNALNPDYEHLFNPVPIVDIIPLSDDQLLTEIRKLYVFYPDYYKRLLQSRYPVNIKSKLFTDYPSVINNGGINGKLETFSEQCRYIKFPKSSFSYIIFLDGVAKYPDYLYETEYDVHMYFKESIIRNCKVTVVCMNNYNKENVKYTIVIDSNYTAKLPPNKHFKDNLDSMIIVREELDTGEMSIITGYDTIMNDDGSITIVFDVVDRTVLIDGGDSGPIPFRYMIDAYDKVEGVEEFESPLSGGDADDAYANFTKPVDGGETAVGIVNDPKLIDGNDMSTSDELVDGETATEQSVYPGDEIGISNKYSVYMKDSGYSKYFSQKYMAIDMPWNLMYNENDMFVYVDNRKSDDYKCINPNTKQLLNKRTIMGFNYESDITRNTPIFVSNMPKMQLYQGMKDLTISNGMVTLDNKKYPFNKKYMLVFVNDKLIDPNNIVEITNYSFGFTDIYTSKDTGMVSRFLTAMSLPVGTNPVYDIKIYKFSFDDEYAYVFDSLNTRWEDYIATLDPSIIKSKFGIIDLYLTSFVQIKQIVDIADIIRDPNQEYFYLYEILYKYILTGDIVLANEAEALKVLHDFDELTDGQGRIVLDSNRGPEGPRYIY